jgi:hypothetical protein
MAYAGANSSGFEQGRNGLAALAGIEIKTERIRRSTTRSGRVRLAPTQLLE